MSISGVYNLLVIVLSMLWVTDCGGPGDSCRGLCCQGTNPTCYALNARSGKRCYCDSHCAKSGDCCRDYSSTCKLERPINCVLSNWKRWSHCSGNCGSGIQKRTRKILIPPNRTGRRCGRLSETRQCKGILCPAQSQSSKQRRTNSQFKAPNSVVQILPDLKSPVLLYRRYSHKHGIRRHMYLRDLFINNVTEVETTKQPYCSYYKITMTFGKCQNLYKLSTVERANWIEHVMFLADSQSICVTCYPQNQQKHLHNRCAGSAQQESRWRAVRSDNCHGYFKLTQRKENCKCRQPSFMMI